jgi:hypothetical protein
VTVSLSGQGASGHRYRSVDSLAPTEGEGAAPGRRSEAGLGLAGLRNLSPIPPPIYRAGACPRIVILYLS